MDSLVGDDPTLPIEFEGSMNPEQLGEVTLGPQLESLGHRMEHPDGSVPMVAKTSSGRMSPIRARTMKEYDQQIAELKKENFSLKLRIYYLEEKMQQRFHDGDDVVKTNIELNVECQSLKKELQDKQELLKKASHALETISDQHQIEMDQAIQQVAQNASFSADRDVRELEEKLRLMEEEIAESQQELEGAREKVLSLEHNNEQLKQQLNEAIATMDNQKTSDNDHLGTNNNHLATEQQTDNTLAQAEHDLMEKIRIIEDLNHVITSKDAKIEQLLEQAGSDSELETAREQLMEHIEEQKAMENQVQQYETACQDLQTQLQESSAHIQELESQLGLLQLTLGEKDVELKKWKKSDVQYRSAPAQTDDTMKKLDERKEKDKKRKERVKELERENKEKKEEVLKCYKAIQGMVAAMQDKAKQDPEGIKDESGIIQEALSATNSGDPTSLQSLGPVGSQQLHDLKSENQQLQADNKQLRETYLQLQDPDIENKQVQETILQLEELQEINQHLISENQQLNSDFKQLHDQNKQSQTDKQQLFDLQTENKQLLSDLMNTKQQLGDVQRQIDAKGHHDMKHVTPTQDGHHLNDDTNKEASEIDINDMDAEQLKNLANRLRKDLNSYKTQNGNLRSQLDAVRNPQADQINDFRNPQADLINDFRNPQTDQINDVRNPQTDQLNNFRNPQADQINDLNSKLQESELRNTDLQKQLDSILTIPGATEKLVDGSLIGLKRQLNQTKAELDKANNEIMKLRGSVNDPRKMSDPESKKYDSESNRDNIDTYDAIVPTGGESPSKPPDLNVLREQLRKAHEENKLLRSRGLASDTDDPESYSELLGAHKLKDARNRLGSDAGSEVLIDLQDTGIPPNATYRPSGPGEHEPLITILDEPGVSDLKSKLDATNRALQSASKENRNLKRILSLDSDTPIDEDTLEMIARSNGDTLHGELLKVNSDLQQALIENVSLKEALQKAGVSHDQLGSKHVDGPPNVAQIQTENQALREIIGLDPTSPIDAHTVEEFSQKDNELKGKLIQANAELAEAQKTNENLLQKIEQLKKDHIRPFDESLTNDPNALNDEFQRLIEENAALKELVGMNPEDIVDHCAINKLKSGEDPSGKSKSTKARTDRLTQTRKDGPFQDDTDDNNENIHRLQRENALFRKALGINKDKPLSEEDLTDVVTIPKEKFTGLQDELNEANVENSMMKSALKLPHNQAVNEENLKAIESDKNRDGATVGQDHREKDKENMMLRSVLGVEQNATITPEDLEALKTNNTVILKHKLIKANDNLKQLEEEHKALVSQGKPTTQERPMSPHNDKLTHVKPSQDMRDQYTESDAAHTQQAIDAVQQENTLLRHTLGIDPNSPVDSDSLSEVASNNNVILKHKLLKAQSDVKDLEKENRLFKTKLNIDLQGPATDEVIQSAIETLLGDTDSEITALKDKVNTLENVITQLRQQNESLDEVNCELCDKLQSANAEIKKLKDDLGTLKSDNIKLQELLKTLQGEAGDNARIKDSALSKIPGVGDDAPPIRDGAYGTEKPSDTVSVGDSKGSNRQKDRINEENGILRNLLGITTDQPIEQIQAKSLPANQNIQELQENIKDLQEQMRELQHQIKQGETQLDHVNNLNDLLKRQIEMNTQSEFNPELIVEMAEEIERLKKELSAAREKLKVQLRKNSTSKPPKSQIPLPKSRSQANVDSDDASSVSNSEASSAPSQIPVLPKTAPGSQWQGPNVSLRQEIERLRGELKDAKNDAKMLQRKLRATEATVRSQAEKIRYLKSLLQDAGLLSQSPRRSNSETNLSSMTPQSLSKFRTVSASTGDLAFEQDRQSQITGPMSPTASFRILPMPVFEEFGETDNSEELKDQVKIMQDQIDRYKNMIRNLQLRNRVAESDSALASPINTRKGSFSGPEVQEAESAAPEDKTLEGKSDRAIAAKASRLPRPMRDIANADTQTRKLSSQEDALFRTSPRDTVNVDTQTRNIDSQKDALYGASPRDTENKDTQTSKQSSQEDALYRTRPRDTVHMDTQTRKSSSEEDAPFINRQRVHSRGSEEDILQADVNKEAFLRLQEEMEHLNNKLKESEQLNRSLQEQLEYSIPSPRRQRFLSPDGQEDITLDDSTLEVNREAPNVDKPFPGSPRYPEPGSEAYGGPGAYTDRTHPQQSTSSNRADLEHKDAYSGPYMDRAYPQQSQTSCITDPGHRDKNDDEYSQQEKMRSLLEQLEAAKNQDFIPPDGSLENKLQTQKDEISGLHQQLRESQQSCQQLEEQLHELQGFLNELLHQDSTGEVDVLDITPSRVSDFKKRLNESCDLASTLASTLYDPIDGSAIQTSGITPSDNADLEKKYNEMKAHLEGEVQQLMKRNQEGLKEYEQQQNRLDELVEKNRELQRILDDLDQSAVPTSDVTPTVNGDQDQMSPKLKEQLEGEIKQLKEQHQELSAQYADLQKSSKADISNQRKQIENLKGQLQEMEQLRNQLREDAIEKQQLQNECENMKEEVQEREELNTKLKELLQDNQLSANKARQQLHQLSNEVGDKNEVISKLSKKVKKLQDKLRQYSSELSLDQLSTNGSPHAPTPGVQSLPPGGPRGQRMSQRSNETAESIERLRHRTASGATPHEQLFRLVEGEGDVLSDHSAHSSLHSSRHRSAPQASHISTTSERSKHSSQADADLFAYLQPRDVGLRQGDGDISESSIGTGVTGSGLQTAADRDLFPYLQASPLDAQSLFTDHTESTRHTGARSTVDPRSTRGQVTGDPMAAIELDNLKSRLNAVEELNETLRGELHLYESMKHMSIGVGVQHSPAVGSRASQTFTTGAGPVGGTFSPGVAQSQAAGAGEASGMEDSDLLQQYLAEIRELRKKLEESIDNNDRLRRQLEQKLEELQRQPDSTTNIYLPDGSTSSKIVHAGSGQEDILAERETVINELRRVQAHNNELVKEIHDIESYCDKYKKDCDNMAAKLRPLELKLQADERSLKDVEKQKTEAMNRIMTLEATVEEKVHDVGELEKIVNERNEKVKDLSRSLVDIENQFIELDTKYKEVDSVLIDKNSRIKDLESEIDGKNRQLNEQAKDIDNKNRQAKLVDTLISQKDNRIKDLMAKINSQEQTEKSLEDLVNEKIKQVSDLDSRLFELQLEYTKLQTTSQDLELRLKNATKMSSSQSSIKSSKSEPNIENVKQQLILTLSENKNLKEEMNALRDVNTNSENSDQMVENLKKQLVITSRENIKLKEDLAGAKDQATENADLNRTLRLELSVYDKMYNEENQGERAKKKDSTLGIDLHELLQEIRLLRKQLERSIDTNNALRQRLEEQLAKGFGGEPRGTNVNVHHLHYPAGQASQPGHHPVDRNEPHSVFSQENLVSEHPVTGIMQPQLTDPGNLNYKQLAADNPSYKAPDNPSYKSTDNRQHESIVPSTAGQLGGGGNPQYRVYLDSQGKPSYKPLDSQGSSGLMDATRQGQGVTQAGGSVYEARQETMGDRRTKRPSSADSLQLLEDKGNRRTIDQMDLANDMSGIHVNSDLRMLYAICKLDDYELLKRQVEESHVALRGMVARINERMRVFVGSSPTQSVEYSTLRAISQVASELDIYATEQTELIRQFVITQLPRDENGKLWTNSMVTALSEEMVKLQDQIRKLVHKYNAVKERLREADQRLMSTNSQKQQALDDLARTKSKQKRMESTLVKQLSKTEKVLKEARGNLQVKTSQQRM
ncbi:unnamed protein product [Owenia fusiformis]|uniref:Uncharacterized protein n=1 Tax=Owenia fusiformis TaxID=6347 RepID=A0A8J1U1D2_OWEFU|nr:unnamed protein product [Owenia fusiformis]